MPRISFANPRQPHEAAKLGLVTTERGIPKIREGEEEGRDNYKCSGDNIMMIIFLTSNKERSLLSTAKLDGSRQNKRCHSVLAIYLGLHAFALLHIRASIAKRYGVVVNLQEFGRVKIVQSLAGLVLLEETRQATLVEKVQSVNRSVRKGRLASHSELVIWIAPQKKNIHADSTHNMTWLLQTTKSTV